MNINIKNIYVGKEQLLYDKKRENFKSAYLKKKINQELLSINKEGFVDDFQSDKEHHGGEDKAVCVYADSYYSYFKSKHNIALPECAFGENLSIESYLDSDICLADQYECGDVIFEVSQPRQPCWKISSILGIKHLTALVVKEAKTGFYLRVLKSGTIKPDDTLNLIKRPYSKFNIEYINKCAYAAKNHQEEIKELIECKELANAYKTTLKRRLINKSFGIEEWQAEE